MLSQNKRALSSVKRETWDGSCRVSLNIQCPGGIDREIQVAAVAQRASGKAGLYLALIHCVVTDL